MTRTSGAHRWGRRLTCVASSTLLCVLYCRVELAWAWVGWLMLVPWLWAIDREENAAGALATGTMMSVAFCLAIFAWLAEAGASYTSTPQWRSSLLLAATAPAFQPQFLTTAYARWRLRHGMSGGLQTGLGTALIWTATEWLLPHFTGDTIGHGLLPFGILRLGAAVVGTAGLTFVVVLVNDRLCLAATQPGSRIAGLAGAVGVVACLFVVGATHQSRLPRTDQARTTVDVTLVQASLPNYEGMRARLGTGGAVREILARHMALSRPGPSDPPPGLIVWPETVYPTTFGSPRSQAGDLYDREIVGFAHQLRSPLLFGTYDRDPHGEYIAAALIHPDATQPKDALIYRKRRLFPLTEYVPSWLETPWVRSALPWLGTWHPGAGPTSFPLQVGGQALRVAPLICRDSVDPSLALRAVRDGADLLATLSNDGWFVRTNGAMLHSTVAAFRSIETATPQLRATNSGITTWFDERGRARAALPAGEPHALRAAIPIGSRPQTLIVLLGDWFGGFATLAALTLWWSERRRASRGESPGAG